MTHLSVVIPVLNEDSLIQELISQVLINVKLVTDDFEIILVDDGSSDNTWVEIEKSAMKEKQLLGIQLSRNFGHHYAITAGLHNAKGEWVVVMDGDLQDRPEVIPALYKKAQEGFEVVFVTRQNRKETFYYKIGQRMFYLLLNTLSGLKFDSRQANFSIINRNVVKAFMNFPEQSRFYGSTIKWLGFKRTSISASHGARFSGKSSYTLKKRIDLALDIIISYSERPLKFAIYLGSVISIISIIFLIQLIYRYYRFGFSVSGWASLIFSVNLFAGAILIVLGIIGVYIGRIYTEVKNRPLYIVKKIVEKENYRF